MNVNFTYTGKFEAPKRQSEYAAGVDLFYNGEEDVALNLNETAKLATGVKVALPHGYVGLLIQRSSLGFKYDAILSNCVGVIDSDYRGEIFVKIRNLSSTPLTIKPNERICQLVITPILLDNWTQVETLDETERGEKGLGSTGKI